MLQKLQTVLEDPVISSEDKIVITASKTFQLLNGGLGSFTDIETLNSPYLIPAQLMGCEGSIDQDNVAATVCMVIVKGTSPEC
jgi:hypothetical protein